MKTVITVFAGLLFSATAPSALAQGSPSADKQEMSSAKDMKGHGAHQKDMKKCEKMHEHMKDMDMKDIDMKDMDMKKMSMAECKAMMDSNGSHAKPGAKAAAGIHHAVATVREVANGKVTLEHEAIKSLGWPAMTMGFSVKDKALQDKLTAGKKVEVDFRKEGANYVITSVK